MRTYAIAGWLLLIMVAGYAMFRVSFEVELLEDRVSELNRQALQEQEAIHVLRAEWSYLNRPERLSRLANDLLPKLQPPAHNQITTIDRIPTGEETDNVLPAAVNLTQSQ